MIQRMLLIALLLCLIGGCGSMQIKDKMVAFDDATRAYQHALSWSEYVVAATSLKSENEAEVEAEIEHLANFKVTAYEPRGLTVVEKDVRIRQIVKISYFRKDDLIVKTIADDQTWQYDPKKRTWLLTTGFPKLK